MKIKKITEALRITNQQINDVFLMFEARMKAGYFTRGTEKMNFKNLILFTLNFVKKSIQLELDSFIKNIMKSEITMTKQAYSQARQKISPRAFILLAEGIIKWYYADDFKTYRGYRLCAIDGLKLEVNNSEILREKYGYVENATVKLARALSSGIYDIENDMILTSKITKYKASERDLAIELIEQLKEIGLKNDLILFDRGYPSSELIKYLEDSEIKYLMRVSSQFLKVVNEAKQEDQIVELRIKGKTIKVRVLRFLLESGVEEILITNLLDESLSIKDFKELYFKRWGIEVKFNELKSRLQIENFSGETPIAIEQDFYASIYLSNMAAIAKAEANHKIERKNRDKKIKHEYKANTNILIGKLKDSLVMALLQDNPRKRKKMMAEIIKELQRNTIPIRPGRNNKRDMGLKANKYSLNKKRCL
jgi:hypothetical protein